MVKDFVKAAGWPFFFFFLFCHEPCAKQLFALLIPIFVSVFLVIHSSMLQMLILLAVLNFMVNL